MSKKESSIFFEILLCGMVMVFLCTKILMFFFQLIRTSAPNVKESTYFIMSLILYILASFLNTQLTCNRKKKTQGSFPNGPKLYQKLQGAQWSMVVCNRKTQLQIKYTQQISDFLFLIDVHATTWTPGNQNGLSFFTLKNKFPKNSML